MHAHKASWNSALTARALMGRLKVSGTVRKGVYKLCWKNQVWNGVGTNLHAGCKNSGGAHLPLRAGWTRSVPDSLLATPANKSTSKIS
jgi:hypothetical protein